MYGCIQTVLSDPHEGNVRREGKLCRRSASRKMNLLTAHCVVSSVRVQRRVRFPSSVSVSIMKARASSAARSLRLHALRRRSSAKIEFPESRWLNVCSFLLLCGSLFQHRLTGEPELRRRFILSGRQSFQHRLSGGHELPQAGSPLTGRGGLGHVSRGRGVKVRQSWTFTGNFTRPAAAGLSALLAEGKIGRK